MPTMASPGTPDYSWTNSIRVPNDPFGWTKATVVPREPGRGDHVDGPTTGCHDGLQGLGTVVDPVADVVDAFTALDEELADRRVGSGPGGELEVGLAHPHHGLLDAILFDDLPVADLGTKGPGVVVDRRLEVVYGDGDVVDLGQQHAGSWITGGMAGGRIARSHRGTSGRTDGPCALTCGKPA